MTKKIRKPAKQTGRKYPSVKSLMEAEKISEDIQKRVNEVKDVPVIWDVQMKDNADGSAIMTFSHDERLVEWFKLENPKKKPTKKNMGDFIIGVLAKAVEKIDGYDIKKAKK